MVSTISFSHNKTIKQTRYQSKIKKVEQKFETAITKNCELNKTLIEQSIMLLATVLLATVVLEIIAQSCYKNQLP